MQVCPIVVSSVVKKTVALQIQEMSEGPHSIDDRPDEIASDYKLLGFN